jgi:hypothetical protein
MKEMVKHAMHEHMHSPEHKAMMAAMMKEMCKKCVEEMLPALLKSPAYIEATRNIVLGMLDEPAVIAKLRKNLGLAVAPPLG